MLEVSGLHKRFGEVVAVEDVSFAARDGEITGLLGPNGAGKTTTLRVLYGLLSPHRGTARVGGHDSHRETTAARRSLGVLPDSPGLYARLTAREHVEYAGRLQGLDGSALAAAVDRLLAELELERVADRPGAGFSQGERRKVALARALVHDPPNLILDEPTNGLDVMSSRAVREQVRRLARAGKCVLFSSHVLPEVSALCDRVVILGRGRVLADATPAELLARTGRPDLESAFVDIIGTEEGLAA